MGTVWEWRRVKEFALFLIAGVLTGFALGWRRYGRKEARRP